MGVSHAVVVAYRGCGGVSCGNCGDRGRKGHAAPNWSARDRRDGDEPVECAQKRPAMTRLNPTAGTRRAWA